MIIVVNDSDLLYVHVTNVKVCNSCVDYGNQFKKSSTQIFETSKLTNDLHSMKQILILFQLSLKLEKGKDKLLHEHDPITLFQSFT